MASATVESAAVADDCSEATLHFEDVPQIDLRLLSQAELYSLSVSSFAPSPSSHDDSVVPIPKIDRSVFNESAGSRKQTYFHLRLAPRNSSPNLTPISRQQTPVSEPEPEPEENSRITSLLKDLFAPHGAELPDDGLEPIPEDDKGNLIPIDVEYDDCVPASSSSVLQAVPIDVVDGPEVKIVETPVFKKKRGRPRKNENSSGSLPTAGDVKPIVVGQNVTVKVQVKEEKQIEERLKVVDFNQIEEELRRKTEGLQTEDEFSEFLSGLSGEWGSRRKKRKIVDSSSFGNVFPAGWKLMLTIKNDGDRVSLGCSRYISPDGQQLESAKDVTSCLHSPFGKDACESNSVPADVSSQLACKITFGNTAGPPPETDQNHHAVGSIAASSSITVNHRNQEPSLISGSPLKFQMRNFKCHKCTLSFDEKDHLLRHLLSSHKKSRNAAARRGLQNPEVSIMIGGKYECQLCRKRFDEKNRFTSHFGNHIKEYVKRVEGSAETTRGRERMSKLQEPIPIDQVSTAEPYNAKIDGERNWEFLNTTVNLGSDLNTYDISTTYQADAPRDESVMMVKNDEQVCNGLGKQQVFSGLPNDAVNAAVDTSRIASRPGEAAEVKPRDNTDGSSENPDQHTVLGMDTKGSMNVVSSVDNLTHETNLKHDAADMSEKNHVINNENLVSSLFDSSMEDIDLDELDDGVEVGNDLLIPEIGNSCFVLGEGVVNDGKQRNEGSLVQIGDKERIMNDSVTGTRTPPTLRGPEKETESESCLPPSSNQQMVLPDTGAAVAGTIEEHRSYNSWHGGKTTGFHQETATSWKDDKNSGVQGRGRSFPVVHSLEKHAHVDEENENRRSIPEVKNLWQQKVLEASSLSAPPNTSSVVGDSGGHFISNVQSMWQQKVLQSSSLSAASLMKDSSKERENAVTRPVIPSLNHNLQDTEEHQKGHSTSKVGNPWQQKVPESSSVSSAHLKTSHHDAHLMDVSSGVMEPTKVSHDSRQHSSVPNYGRSERSSGAGLPFSPQHQQSFPAIYTSPSIKAMEASKDFRSFRGQSPSYQDHDKNIGNLTSFRNRDKQQKHEEAAASTWHNANSFAFDSRYSSLHDGNAAMGFVQDRSAEGNAHLFARNAQTVAPDHRGNVASARNTQTVAPDHHHGNVISARNTHSAAPDHRGNVVSARNTPTVGPPDHRRNVVSARNTQTVAPDHHGNVVSARNAETDRRGKVVFAGTAEEPKRNNEPPIFGLFSAGVDQQASSINNYNMNVYYSGTMPSDHRRGASVGPTGNSEQMMGYYNQSKPRQEVVMTQPTWRAEENTLQNGLNYASHPMAQQPDCFPTYNMAPDNKVQSGYYGSSNQKIGNSQSGGGGGVRSGGGEYLEYNFLPVQSTTTSHSGGSKITTPPLSQQQQMQQQQQQQQQHQNYDSNWLQKDALGLFPKGSSTSNNSSSSSHHQVTALCVFCGSQFNTDGDFDEDAVGYMCLNCKAKFAAGPLNFF